MKKIVFVCLGNICRSPMAEFVMKDLTDSFHIESRATSSWEHGNPIYPGTQKIFQEYSIPFDQTKTSQQISQTDFEEFDVIIGMDSNNVRDLRKMAPAQAQDKIFQFADNSVPDPWYTGDFQETYRMVKQGCQDWLKRL
ncbi:low molecular weight protein-tyrosine-phosphatase [Streptococcus suis]|uniref:low molecular weight protein-tyrosine-phosphatase n=1 Tax=Streptococcus suis TaxID=1307 RepID=UPI0005CF4B49|nr:low molecular weight protein-tyrosine-phosphatase [Streptococcus suis]CYV13292.1 phosphotyrosine protein phosphatase [Streptococcus suis]HEM5209470.1 low molecular weight phosphotyrosine protein phosphatase [Streptococcus suis]HEM5236677.1 low molecular weight phosphotyrosine protein phosphatase [Streptococcus suis]HEM5243044.1 low molecular weight phosphotyrosine protein phosphatase [Streptococcus suis]